ncbi:hypothetical protein QVD17_10000 [Tagetes erecta]|uniref:Uncharacterized protein n=1 Tax=Tagetes erecta TaxID=13708 RepID=A0AAD8L0A7_TARER|nr:hypothetical protein QVD17_10000 [Tagetes erecta]
MAPLEKDLESSRQAVGLMEERLKSQEVRHSDEITAHQVELDSHRVLLERAEEHARELERKVAEAEARATLLTREKEDHIRAVEGYEARLKALADNEKKNEERGLAAGAAYAKKNVPIESHPEFDPDARQALKDRAETLQSSDHQLISQLAECSDKSVEEISGLIARYNASSS